MSGRRRSRRSTVVGLGAACLTLATACGGPPAGGPPDASGTTADTVYAEFGPLTGDERRERLVAAAAEEGNVLSLYTSLNADVADAIVPAFTAAYGIEVQIYRADSETILQRTLQENSAGFAGADIVETNVSEMVVIADMGLGGDYRSEQRDKVNPDFQFEGWTPTRMNLFTPAWNTTVVSGDMVPTTWEDLAAPRFDGLLSLEVGDYDWYMTLYDHFRSLGRSDAEIDDLFARMAQGAKVAKGHSGQVELLSAGEFGIVGACYSYQSAKARNSGAPVESRPFVEPVVVRANGGALLRSAPHPATAMLFMDWFLADGQQLLLDQDLTPAVMPDGTDPLAGLEVLPVDGGKLLAEGADWSARYDQLLQGGTSVASN